MKAVISKYNSDGYEIKEFITLEDLMHWIAELNCPIELSEIEGDGYATIYILDN